MQSGGVTYKMFIEAAKNGGDAGLATVKSYIAANRNNFANINVVDQYGYTALICAACNGHTRIVTALLAIPGIAINVANPYGYTALILAASYGHTRIVTALLAIPGIAINVANPYGYTALKCAAYNGHTRIVAALLAEITNIDDLDFSFWTAEQVAGAQRHFEIAALIRARIVELGGLPNNLEEKAPNPQVQLSPTFEERLKKIEFKDENIPKKFLCPISYAIMNDPVAVSSGIAYDRVSLEQWFSLEGNPVTLKCAVTKEYDIKISDLENQTTQILKNDIEEFVKEQEKIANDAKSKQDPANVQLNRKRKNESLDTSETKSMRMTRASHKFFDNKNNNVQSDVANRTQNNTDAVEEVVASNNSSSSSSSMLTRHRLG